MSARDEILANIRASLGVTGAEAPRRLAVRERLAQAPSGVIPARGQGDAGSFEQRTSLGFGKTQVSRADRGQLAGQT